VLLVDVLVLIFSKQDHERNFVIRFWEQLKRVAGLYDTTDMVQRTNDDGETSMVWDL
jgi:hypothetical protein